MQILALNPIKASLTAVKLQMIGNQTCHVWCLIKTCFFFTCPRLDENDGNLREGKNKSFLKKMTLICFYSWVSSKMSFWFVYHHLRANYFRFGFMFGWFKETHIFGYKRSNTVTKIDFWYEYSYKFNWKMDSKGVVPVEHTQARSHGTPCCNFV